jgi:hypothetical protein
MILSMRIVDRIHSNLDEAHSLLPEGASRYEQERHTYTTTAPRCKRCGDIVPVPIRMHSVICAACSEYLVQLDYEKQGGEFCWYHEIISEKNDEQL